MTNRRHRGRDGWCGSLTVSQVRGLAVRGHTHATIAEMAGVSRPCVSRALRGFRSDVKAARARTRRQEEKAVRAEWLRRKSVSHTAKKLGIPPGRVVAIRRSLGLRGRAEPRLHLPVRHPDFPYKLFRRPSRPKEWLCWSPYSRRTVRVARFLAERRFGRTLRPDEWAILKDGADDNLTDANVLVCSPQEAAARLVVQSRATRRDGAEAPEGLAPR